MKRLWIVSAVVVLVGLLTTSYVVLHRAEDEIDSGQFGNWPPDVDAIRKALPVARPEAGDDFSDARHLEFATLFQSRFRKHDPGMAVGLRFYAGNHIVLMCPARMEPWSMDDLAMTAWRETRDTFGHAYNIQLCRTYIGMALVPVGEVHVDPNQPQIAHIIYHYPGAPPSSAPSRARPDSPSGLAQ